MATFVARAMLEAKSWREENAVQPRNLPEFPKAAYLAGPAYCAKVIPINTFTRQLSHAACSLARAESEY